MRAFFDPVPIFFLNIDVNLHASSRLQPTNNAATNKKILSKFKDLVSFTNTIIIYIIIYTMTTFALFFNQYFIADHLRFFPRH